MSRPLKSAPSQKNVSRASVSGRVNGAIGLFGSSSGKNGAVTAMNSQKNTRDAPITATLDSRQLETATRYRSTVAGIAGSSTRLRQAPSVWPNMTCRVSGPHIRRTRISTARGAARRRAREGAGAAVAIAVAMAPSPSGEPDARVEEGVADVGDDL